MMLEKPGIMIEANKSISVVPRLLSQICTNLISVINHRFNDSHYQRPETRSQKETEAAMFLRLDQVGHTPKSAKRTLDYWRFRGDLKATKYARHIWFLREELESFLKGKTKK